MKKIWWSVQIFIGTHFSELVDLFDLIWALVNLLDLLDWIVTIL